MKLRLFTPAVALIATGCVVPAGAEALRERSEVSVPVSGFSRLEVHNARGLVDVRTGASRRILIDALKITHGRSGTDLERLAADTEVLTEVVSDRLVVQVRYPRGQSIKVNVWDAMKHGVSVPRVEVRLSLQVPPGFPVELDASSGDLATVDLSGPQRLKTVSGDVTVEAAADRVEVSTSSGDVWATGLDRARVATVSGDVQIDGARGPLRVQTSSGDVAVRGAADSVGIATVSGDVQVAAAPRGLGVATSSGDVRVRESRGRVRIETVSGGVDVGLHEPLVGADIETSSGSVQAALAPSLACALELRSSSGSIDLDVPARTQTSTNRLVTARVRNGVTPVRLRTTSGSITVSGGR